VKEFVIALVVVGALTVLLATVFSSPDRKAITLADWANADTSAGYGAPYNHASGGQKIGPLALQKWFGVRIPVDSANDLVISPLNSVSGDPALTAALSVWHTASSDQQTKWATAYADALAAAPDGNPTEVNPATSARSRSSRTGSSCSPYRGTQRLADVQEHLLRR
jgi:hypothetical protein